MAIDIGICNGSNSLKSFIEMAHKIGYRGLASQNIEGARDQQLESGFSVLKRADVSGRGLKSIRKKVDNVRKHVMVVSVTLSTVETANWAAEDTRVDLITLDHSNEERLRESTAKLASLSNTALEIRIEPLIQLTGLNRSKVIKFYRESVNTATASGMSVVLSSGATHPLNMRSPISIQYVGELLGMEAELAKDAINKFPMDIIERNRRKFSSNYIMEGVEVVQRGIDE